MQFIRITELSFKLYKKNKFFLLLPHQIWYRKDIIIITVIKIWGVTILTSSTRPKQKKKKLAVGVSMGHLLRSHESAKDIFR